MPVNLTSDQQILWQHGFVKLNGTIVMTWAMMIVMSLGAKLITRKLKTEGDISRWQGSLEIVVTAMEEQIKEVGLSEPAKYLSFLGTLFLFVATASLCTVIPGYKPPTGSLSTTAALALCVFVAVPLFGIREQGLSCLPQDLHEADVHHAAVQYHQRSIAHAGLGRSSVRQHDERGDDYRHFAYDHALYLSDFHDRARSAHRHGASLYLQHSGHGLHCSRHPHTETEAAVVEAKPDTKDLKAQH